jgi:vancomycin resistance protein YoaR
VYRTVSRGVHPTEDRPSRRSRRRRSRLWRWRVPGFVVLGVAVAVAVGVIAERLVYRDRVLPGVSVAGVEVATKDDDTARDSIEARARKLETEPVPVRAGKTNLSLDPAAIDYQVDAAAIAKAAEDAGRSGNPVGQVLGTALRRFRDDEVDIVASWDRQKLDAVLASWDLQLVAGRRDAGLEFHGAQVVEVPPASGLGLKRKQARAGVEAAMRDGERHPVRVPVGPSRPSVGEAAMRDAAARARAILAAPVDLLVNGSSVTVSPEQLGPTMTATPKEGSLELGIDAAKLRDTLASSLGPLEAAPVDARFTWSGPNVMIVPSTAGRVVDLPAATPAILAGQRQVPAPVVEVQPARNTEWAQRLNITEVVSTFTTNHPAGQPRVYNIHRACDLVNGTVVEPGETFSLNEAIGPRTPQRGFVEAPAFATDEGFFEAYGGGVSQFSTTVFNATFFGGYKDVKHTPHSIYITRYPLGREATLDYPGIDNQFQDDSGAGVLVTCSYTDASITVTYYGNKEGKVVEAEGPIVLEQTPPTTECVDPAAAQGEAGYTGYRVENYRVINQPGRPGRRERFSWKYDMRPQRVAC